MTLDEAKKYYIDVLEKLRKQYNFDAFLKKRNAFTWNEWVSCYKEIVRQRAASFDLKFKNGVTRAVIFEENVNYVVKVSFSNCRYDYCDDEYRNYLCAKERGKEYFFAPCDFLGVIGNVNFYIMEKAICGEGAFTDFALSVCPDVVSSYGSNCTDEEAAEEVCEAAYGEESDDFFEITDELGINDMHGGNFGFIDGRMVLIDYGGFYGMNDIDEEDEDECAVY